MPTSCRHHLSSQDIFLLCILLLQTQISHTQEWPRDLSRLLFLLKFLLPSNTGDINTLLSTFLSDFKSLITPLISLLTTMVSRLLPNQAS
uniref:Putative secreted protein n=1 Tax=Panstrongylus lignarius TaxID=156445 RepID=A0A224XRT2_9HEMI